MLDITYTWNALLIRLEITSSRQTDDLHAVEISLPCVDFSSDNLFLDKPWEFCVQVQRKSTERSEDQICILSVIGFFSLLLLAEAYVCNMVELQDNLRSEFFA